MSKIADLEALLFVAGDNGLTERELCDFLQVSPEELTQLTKALIDKRKNEQDSGLQVIHLNHSYKMTTSARTSQIIERYFNKSLTQSLSQSALEILSIIAYRQPITRVEIDDIRGVNSSGAIQTLVWRGLVKASGKKDAPGHPNLYVTTDYFLQYFNFESLSDLPLIEDFEENPDSEIEMEDKE